MPANAPAAPVIPFVAAAHEHVEPIPISPSTFTPTTTAQTVEFNVPSYGYLRHIYLQIVLTGGSGGNFAADAPWNLLDQVTLLDTNGAPIVAPLDGYSLYIMNYVGGYGFNQDPANCPWFSSTSPNAAFFLRIPVEISHYDGLGSIANQNSAAPYRVRFNINTIANVWVTAPSTDPTITVTPLLEAWSLPNQVDGMGRPQATIPPNHGTVQYHTTRNNITIGVGQNTTQVTRVGSLIRNLVFIARDESAVRTAGVFPDPPIINWDARQLLNETQKYRQCVQNERGQPGSTAQPTGVFVYSFDHSMDNHSGDDRPTLWIPTVQATRLELQGASATAGTMQYIVNDVAPVTVDPTQRYVENAATGFHPNPDR